MYKLKATGKCISCNNTVSVRTGRVVFLVNKHELPETWTFRRLGDDWAGWEKVVERSKGVHGSTK
ncbi:hypothetical protein FIBSPDRAFT_868689, partial [Athelia psychrophila]